MTTPQRPLYFDYNATTPVDPRVLETMLPYFTEHFGNAESGAHAYGWKAKSAVENARKQVAALINADASEVVFTSGSTESVMLATLGFLEGQEPKRHLITTRAEHKCTLDVCAKAEKLGHEVTYIPVNRYGQVSAADIVAALRPNTALVTLMHANNEIGSLNPIAEIGALLRSRGIAFHVDAAQTIGKHPIDVKAMNIDLLSVSAHKYYGPKGIGALYVRRSAIHIAPLMKGGGQEKGLRGGTHNVPGIVGLGKASEIARLEMDEERTRLEKFRDKIIARFATLPGVELNGHPTERLCNNIHVSFRGLGADDLLLGTRDLAFSTASACSGGAMSHVLGAVGVTNPDPLFATARFSLGRFTTEAEVDTLIERITAVVQNAQGVSSSYASSGVAVPNTSEIC